MWAQPKVAVAIFFALIVLCRPVCATNPWELEVGRATTSPASFITISFSSTFQTTPVIVALPTNENSDPAALRIRNVTTSGFEVALVEPSGNNGVVDLMTFDYIAATPGINTLPDGQIIAVGTHTTTTQQAHSTLGITTGWDTVAFGKSFAPSSAVIASIQTTNSETSSAPGTPSIPWLTTTMRNANTNDFQVALERAEAAPGTPIAETIG